MEYVAVESSNIRAIGYNPDLSILGVQFNNGMEYHYFNVPYTVFESLLQVSSSGESVGKYFNAKIRNSEYEYRQIN